MFDLCTIGHITLDKVVTPQSVNFMPGGTSFYFSKALQHFDISYALVTAVGRKDVHVVNDLRTAGILVHDLPSEHSVFFENIYSQNQNHREQNVLQTAAPFTIENMPDIDARFFHLGPLLADDMQVELIKKLAEKATLSLDVQGFLRYVDNQKVKYTDWKDKLEALPCISILKANEFEMEAICGTSNLEDGARQLANAGVKEVVITLGSEGSMIFTEGMFYTIPAFTPTAVTDATGCGDTYMAGYLYKKAKGAGIQEAGEFGAAMATLKIQSSGPFVGTPDMVEQRKAAGK